MLNKVLPKLESLPECRCGKLVTPGGAVEICHILGREETIKRVKAGIAKLA